MDALISQIYFWNKTLHVSDSSSVHHQEFFTVNTAMVCHTACEQDQVGTDPARKLSANLYVLLCVQWKSPDDGQRNCSKHVEFYSKNIFEKLMNLVVGFIIRIYYYARSFECQIDLEIVAPLLRTLQDLGSKFRRDQSQWHVFHGLPPSLKTNTGTAVQIRPGPLPLMSLLIQYSFIVLSNDAKQTAPLTGCSIKNKSDFDWELRCQISVTRKPKRVAARRKI